MRAKKRIATPWWRTEGVLGHFFKTKAELETKVRSIVARYPLETPMEQDDVAFLCRVLEHHYDWQQRVGAGVSTIVTRPFVAWSGTSTGLVLKRVDGTEVDISWVVALMPGGAPSEKLNAVGAARYEVVAQRNAADKNTPVGAACPLCGAPLLAGDRHVDHKPPATFDTLFETWMRLEEGLDYAQIKVEEVGVDLRFSDRSLAESWASYRKAHAVLRVIHKHENLRRAA